MVSAREFFSDGWTEDMLRSAFRAGNFYGFIAADTVFTDGDGAKEKVLGFITFSVAGDTADLQDLFVFPEERKKGAGKRLLAEFIADARLRGVNKLFLEVRESNSSAIQLYLSAGFYRLSVRKKYYDDGENALVLIKELN